MRVMVLGLRGFPDIQGGIEKHSEQLYPKLASVDCHIEVLGRSPFLKDAKSVYKNVHIRRLPSPGPEFKGIEAMAHSFIGCLYAGLKRPDILHIHAVGPALFTPLARLMGLRVTVTHHGFDYQREKWNAVARWIIQLGEHLGMRFAHARIAVSETIKKHIETKYRKEAVNIPNGVIVSPAPVGRETLQTYNLVPQRYFLMVSRLVPEKRQMDLIEAFEQVNIKEWKLVLVGALTPKDAYINNIINRCRKNPNIILTDFLSGVPLAELYHHAGCFVLPSTHEGLPIVILEALSHGVQVIASNIEPNLEIGLPQDHYFSARDIQHLSLQLRKAACDGISDEVKNKLVAIAGRYSWDSIAEKTYAVYRQCLHIGKPTIRKPTTTDGLENFLLPSKPKR